MKNTVTILRKRLFPSFEGSARSRSGTRGSRVGILPENMNEKSIWKELLRHLRR